MPPDGPAEATEISAILDKGRRILREQKLGITKDWLNLLIGRIDDIQALESFPTQESIRTSVSLIEGLADSLQDESLLAQFEPGGQYYEQAALLGLLQKDNSGSIEVLSSSLDALEDALWDRLAAGMRRQDQDIFRMVRILRQGLHLIMTAALEAYHLQSNAELDRLAYTDPLTGLYNRRYLEKELERHVEMFKRYRHPFAILMLDFDNLKFLNDTFGHAAGDQALQHLAKLMRMSIRDVDIPCRFGGDEFIVVMPQTNKEAIQAVGRRISEAVAKTQLKLGRGLATLQISYGIAACPEDGVEAEVLLQNADAGLYRAKETKAERAGR
jgi:diguanylate cyclase (GGDEF)-like protein